VILQTFLDREPRESVEQLRRVRFREEEVDVARRERGDRRVESASQRIEEEGREGPSR
jgi:hypothetical protein